MTSITEIITHYTVMKVTLKCSSAAKSPSLPCGHPLIGKFNKATQEGPRPLSHSAKVKVNGTDTRIGLWDNNTDDTSRHLCTIIKQLITDQKQKSPVVHRGGDTVSFPCWSLWWLFSSSGWLWLWQVATDSLMMTLNYSSMQTCKKKRKKERKSLTVFFPHYSVIPADKHGHAFLPQQ